jgi:hypothetical protein
MIVELKGIHKPTKQIMLIILYIIVVENGIFHEKRTL